jgi:hypothetical protein
LAPTEYILNIRIDRIIGVDEKLGVNKTLALTEGVDKNSALAKYRRRQKLGVSKMLAQRQKISLLLGSAGSAAADFSQAPLKVSYFSLMVTLLSMYAVVK